MQTKSSFIQLGKLRHHLSLMILSPSISRRAIYVLVIILVLFSLIPTGFVSAASATLRITAGSLPGTGEHPEDNAGGPSAVWFGLAA